jgi:HEAT repeat protein
MRGAILLWALVGAASAQDGAADEKELRRRIEQLGADFLEERQAAREALEKFGARAEGALLEALRSPDHRVRGAALELLTLLKSARALEAARAIFESDEDAGVRDAAFGLLRALGPRAEEALIGALRSPRPEHRAGALQSLTEFKSARAAKDVADLHDREEDPEVKALALRCLQSLGPPAEPFLLKYLGSPDAALRREALEGLRSSSSPEALEAAGKLFARETEVPVLNAAFDFLRQAGPRAAPYFVEALRGPQEHARARAIEGLKALRHEAAIGPVGEVLRKDGSDSVRAAAADFLKGMGLKAEGPLVEALSAEDRRVRLLALEALGEIQSEKPLEAVRRLYREDPDREVHRAAFEYLRRLGKRAEKDLLAALSDEDKEIRRRAILALGEAGSEEAIAPLVGFLVQRHDVEIKGAARDALVRIGPKALEAVRRAAAAGEVDKEIAGEMEALRVQEEVEGALDRWVTDLGQSGTFEGQFRDLEALGREKAFPVLRRMARESGFAWRLADRRPRGYAYEVRMRELAILALGALGDRESVGVLKEALREAGPAGTEGGFREELLVALHRLGEKEPLEEFVERTRREAEEALRGDAKEQGCTLLFSVGLVLNRAGRRDEAREAYRAIVKAVEEHRLAEAGVLPTAAYNLACLEAQAGRTREAVEWLEKAVRAGFKDRQWIRMDRDLDPIRDEERYRALLADEALFRLEDRN